MTPPDVRARVEAIREFVWDDERAHSVEDKIREDVLRAIASGAPDAAALAREALRTERFDFARHCA